MIWDVKQALVKDPSLSVGRYKVFFNKPEFVCSHQMIRSLPFKFVKQLTVGVESNLPQDFIKAVQNDALRAETNHIRSIQLWRSIAMDFSAKKDKKYYIIGPKLRRALPPKKHQSKQCIYIKMKQHLH